MPRRAQHAYIDPLDAIWLTVAERVGFRVQRSDAVYASVRDGVVWIGESASLDPDDCLAQMIFHELCHSLIEGPAKLGVEDWGLGNVDDRDVPREHACLRLQAALSQRYGLREALAPTTDFRAYYDGLPGDPMGPGQGDPDPVLQLAAQGLQRSEEPPWGPHIDLGLRATERILRVARDFGAADPGARLPPLWTRLGDSAASDRDD